MAVLPLYLARIPPQILAARPTAAHFLARPTTQIMPTRLLRLRVPLRPLVGSLGTWVLILERGRLAVGCSARNLPLARWGCSGEGEIPRWLVPGLLGLALGCLVNLLPHKGRGRVRLGEDCSATPIRGARLVLVLVCLVSSLLVVLGRPAPVLALALVFSAI